MEVAGEDERIASLRRAVGPIRISIGFAIDIAAKQFGLVHRIRGLPMGILCLLLTHSSENLMYTEVTHTFSHG